MENNMVNDNFDGGIIAFDEYNYEGELENDIFKGWTIDAVWL